MRGKGVFTRSNLDALSTTDGSLLWSTDYPPVDFPRMTGIAADDTGVFVALGCCRQEGTDQRSSPRT